MRPHEFATVAKFIGIIYNMSSMVKIALMIEKKAKKTETSCCGHLCVGHR